MKTLAELLNFIVTTLQLSPLYVRTDAVSTQSFSEQQFALKVRVELANGSLLQVRLYRNGEHTDYAYQLVRNNEPILRWDNKEHFPTLPTYPHHFHSDTDQVEKSPLTGDPVHDLPFVLDALASASNS